MVQTTGFPLAPTLIVFGVKSVVASTSEGSTMSSGTEVTASVAVGVNCATLPT